MVKFCSNDPSLFVVLWNAHSAGDIDWLYFRKYGGACIALLFRTIPKSMRILQKQLIHLIGMSLCFLKAKNISIFLLDSLQTIILYTSSNTIYIPGNEFHDNILSSFFLRFVELIFKYNLRRRS